MSVRAQLGRRRHGEVSLAQAQQKMRKFGNQSSRRRRHPSASGIITRSGMEGWGSFAMVIAGLLELSSVSSQYVNGGDVEMSCEACLCTSDDGTIDVFDNPSSGQRMAYTDGDYSEILETSCGSSVVAVGSTLYELSGIDLTERTFYELDLSSSDCTTANAPSSAPCYTGTTSPTTLDGGEEINFEVCACSWTDDSSGTRYNTNVKYVISSSSSEVELPSSGLDVCVYDDFETQLITATVDGDSYYFNLDLLFPGEDSSADLSVSSAPGSSADTSICEGDVEDSTPAPVTPATDPPQSPAPTAVPETPVPVDPSPTPSPTALSPPTPVPSQTEPPLTTDSTTEEIDTTSSTDDTDDTPATEPPAEEVEETEPPTAEPTDSATPAPSDAAAVPIATPVPVSPRTSMPTARPTARPTPEPTPNVTTTIINTSAPSATESPVSTQTQTLAPSATAAPLDITEPADTQAPSTLEGVEDRECELPLDDPCTEDIYVVDTNNGIGSYYDPTCTEDSEEAGCGTGTSSTACRACFFNRPLYVENVGGDDVPDYTDCPCCVMDTYSSSTTTLEECSDASTAIVTESPLGADTGGIGNQSFDDKGMTMAGGEGIAVAALGLFAVLSFLPGCLS